MTSRIKRKCPECGKPKLVRLIGKGAEQHGAPLRKE